MINCRKQIIYLPKLKAEAKILISARILKSGFGKAKILKSVKILNSGLLKAKIFKSAKILKSGFCLLKNN